MADVDADTLLPSSRMRESARSGDVTQIHRGQAYADPGDRFTVGDATFEIVEVTERTLGDLTDEDARKEGARDLDHYREILQRAHEHFEWDDGSEVILHRFERV